jgi:hypothetical protein
MVQRIAAKDLAPTHTLPAARRVAAEIAEVVTPGERDSPIHGDQSRDR